MIPVMLYFRNNGWFSFRILLPIVCDVISGFIWNFTQNIPHPGLKSLLCTGKHIFLKVENNQPLPILGLPLVKKKNGDGDSLLSLQTLLSCEILPKKRLKSLAFMIFFQGWWCWICVPDRSEEDKDLGRENVFWHWFVLYDWWVDISIVVLDIINLVYITVVIQ